MDYICRIAESPLHLQKSGGKFGILLNKNLDFKSSGSQLQDNNYKIIITEVTVMNT